MSSASAELLRLTTTGITNQEGSVVGGKLVLQFLLAPLVDELLVVGDKRLGESLADGVDLQ